MKQSIQLYFLEDRSLQFCRLARIEQNYFIIAYRQSIAGFLFFPLAWLFPIRVLKISRNDFERLVKQNHGKNKSFQSFGASFLWTVLGLALGGVIYRFTYNLSIKSVLSFLLVFLAVLFCYGVILFQEKKKYDRLALSLDFKEKVSIKLTAIDKRKTVLPYLLIGCVFFSLIALFLWGYFQTSSFLGCLFVAILLVLFLHLQLIFAVIPGHYTYEELS